MQTENEERLFNSLKEISLATSSRTRAHVRDNSILRLQAEMNFKQQEGIDSTKSINSKISKFSNAGKLAPSQGHLNQVKKFLREEKFVKLSFCKI